MKRISGERETIIDALNEAILSVWDLAALDDSESRAASLAMANAALAYLEAEGFSIVKLKTILGTENT